MFAAPHSTRALAHCLEQMYAPRSTTCFRYGLSTRALALDSTNSGYLLHLPSIRPLHLCISLRSADVCSAYLYCCHSTRVLACHMLSYRLHPLCIYLTCTVRRVQGHGSITLLAKIEQRTDQRVTAQTDSTVWRVRRATDNIMSD